MLVGAGPGRRLRADGLGRGLRSPAERRGRAGPRGGAQRPPRAARARHHRAGRSAAPCGPAPRRMRASMPSSTRAPPRSCVEDGRAVGVEYLDPDGDAADAPAPARRCSRPAAPARCIRETTNPEVASGDGIAMAWAAGARVADLEFVQFHPTALQVEGQPRFLLSEALRGEGARLVNADGEPFMTRYEAAGRPGAARSRVARHRPRAGPHRPAGVPVAAAPRRGDGARPLPAHRRGVPRRRARPGARSGAGQPGRALRDGRRRDRPRRPDLGARAVRRRRGRLHRRPRRQPPGQQLAARGPRLRTPGRAGDGRDRRRHVAGPLQRAADAGARRSRGAAAEAAAPTIAAVRDADVDRRSA